MTPTPKTLRVLLATDADVFAGTERHMLDLAGALRQVGVDAAIACPVPSELAVRAPAAGIGIVPIPIGGMVERRAVAVLVRKLRSGDVDVLHAHNGRSHLLCALAVALAGRGACVATQHFLEPSHTAQRGIKALLSRTAHRIIGSRTHAYVAISDAVRERFLARGQAAADAITTVPNGIGDIAAAVVARAAVRAELGVPAGDLLIVCVARLEPEKDVATLLDSFAHVRSAEPRARLAVVGAGSQDETLRAQAARLGIGDAVVFTGFRQDARTLMAASDLYVLPSTAEGFGLVLAEAMALGRPVVSTDCGGPREIVVDGQTGLLVPPGDREAMAAAILRLCRDGELREAFGAAGRRRFEERFSANRMARGVAEVYELAIARSHGRSQAAAAAVEDPSCASF